MVKISTNWLGIVRGVEGKREGRHGVGLKSENKSWRCLVLWAAGFGIRCVG